MTKPEPPRNPKVYARSTTNDRYRIPPPLAKPDEIWSRITELLADEPAATAQAEKPKEARRKRGAARRRARRLRWRRILDVVAMVTWSPTIIKLFIGDLDRTILSSVAPGALWVLDVRWFLVLAVAALLLLLLNGRTLGLSLGYVVCYPLVILLWKLPKSLIKRQSPLLAIALASVTFNLAARTRPFIYAVTLETLCGLIILTSGEHWLIWVAVTAFTIVLVWWLTVMAVDMFRTEALLRAQNRFIRWLLGFKILEKVVTTDQPDQLSLKDWKIDDAKQYRDRAGAALIVRQILFYWAEAVTQYRRGPAVAVLNALVVAGMIAQIVVAFAFINYGIYVVDPAQYTAASSPDAATFLYYSAAAIYFGEVDNLVPIGTWAVIAKLSNGLIGSIGVLTIVASFLVSLRPARADAGATTAIRTLTRQADDLGAVIETQYRTNLNDLRDRLQLVEWSGHSALVWLVSRSRPDHAGSTIGTSD
jgi:hypothetical protein